MQAMVYMVDFMICSQSYEDHHRGRTKWDCLYFNISTSYGQEVLISINIYTSYILYEQEVIISINISTSYILCGQEVIIIFVLFWSYLYGGPFKTEARHWKCLYIYLSLDRFKLVWILFPVCSGHTLFYFLCQCAWAMTS